MLTVVDLSPYWAWPPSTGGSQRVYNMNRRVAEQVQLLQFSARPRLEHQRAPSTGWLTSRSQQITDHSAVAVG